MWNSCYCCEHKWVVAVEIKDHLLFWKADLDNKRVEQAMTGSSLQHYLIIVLCNLYIKSIEGLTTTSSCFKRRKTDLPLTISESCWRTLYFNNLP